MHLQPRFMAQRQGLWPSASGLGPNRFSLEQCFSERACTSSGFCVGLFWVRRLKGPPALSFVFLNHPLRVSDFLVGSSFPGHGKFPSPESGGPARSTHPPGSDWGVNACRLGFDHIGHRRPVPLLLQCAWALIGQMPSGPRRRSCPVIPGSSLAQSCRRRILSGFPQIPSAPTHPSVKAQNKGGP